MCLWYSSMENSIYKEKISVEICSANHPAWTGEQRIVDTEGRVDRMKRRYNLESSLVAMKKHFYGGQAVIEGVMIRGITNCVVAVRNKKKRDYN